MGRAPTKDDYVKLVDALPRKSPVQPPLQPTRPSHTPSLLPLSKVSHTDQIAYSAGTNWNAIRQRFSKLRKDQQKRFEELGWEMTDGAAVKTPKTTTPKKRSVGEDGAGDGGETPTKKPRARKGKKEIVKKEVAEDDMLGEDAGVKEELVEEDV